jgi:hypothetical protein
MYLVMSTMSPSLGSMVLCLLKEPGNAAQKTKLTPCGDPQQLGGKIWESLVDHYQNLLLHENFLLTAKGVRSSC